MLNIKSVSTTLLLASSLLVAASPVADPTGKHPRNNNQTNYPVAKSGKFAVRGTGDKPLCSYPYDGKWYPIDKKHWGNEKWVGEHSSRHWVDEVDELNWLDGAGNIYFFDTKGRFHWEEHRYPHWLDRNCIHHWYGVGRVYHHEPWEGPRCYYPDDDKDNPRCE
ncbi:hypothetical protein ACJ73_09171 [Blastomyces percursus]|uniref:Uncharacterized protein n=1 Tax=Blastomyces percursus TaxID=1658174 RepID=A0A1J9QEW3_9EURO|nr:hypothetical protein ACJ73_09171 [Blastomyces percursus]